MYVCDLSISEYDQPSKRNVELALKSLMSQCHPQVQLHDLKGCCVI